MIKTLGWISKKGKKREKGEHRTDEMSRKEIIDWKPNKSAVAVNITRLCIFQPPDKDSYIIHK